MKKIIIPTILTATVLLAGMFAFMPVEKASTVHTTIQATTGTFVLFANDDADADAASEIEIECGTEDGDFVLQSLVITGAVDDDDTATVTDIEIDDVALTTEAGAAIADTDWLTDPGGAVTITQDLLEDYLDLDGIPQGGLPAQGVIDVEIAGGAGDLEDETFDVFAVIQLEGGVDASTCSVDIEATPD